MKNPGCGSETRSLIRSREMPPGDVVALGIEGVGLPDRSAVADDVAPARIGDVERPARLDRGELEDRARLLAVFVHLAEYS
jgi:hypothetical protein